MAWTQQDLMDAIGVGCIRFVDPESDRWVVNHVRIEAGTPIPRVGERVFLPGEGRMGSYEVAQVRYFYDKAPEQLSPPQAALLAIEVRVRKLGFVH